MIKKISRAWKPAACMLALTLCVSCGDLDLVPEGETTLDKTADLELLLNRKTIRSNPNEIWASSSMKIMGAISLR